LKKAVFLNCDVQFMIAKKIEIFVICIVVLKTPNSHRAADMKSIHSVVTHHSCSVLMK
jgi:hypothetical protein